MFRDFIGQNQIMNIQYQNQYPTKDEILEKEIKFKKETIAYVKRWKQIWMNMKRAIDNESKFTLIKVLLEGLASEVYNNPVRVRYEHDLPSPCYRPAEKMIIMNKSLSIISGLHELSHHLNGKSEKKACQWSVWLFKKTFPKAYNKLEWKGHLLVKKQKNGNRKQ